MAGSTEVWRLGPFSLEENLRSDRKGTVYRAIHLEQRRQFAVKMFQAPFLARGPARDDFFAEITQLKRLRHSHLPRCFGGGVDKGFAYLVHELIEGEDLATLLQRRNRLPWELAVEYAIGVCDALEYGVKEGFVHHDLTPEKIMIDSSGAIRVVDFRWMRLKNLCCASSIAHSLPHVAYHAPEWFDRPDEASHKADIYSLGCVLFEMLCGQPPFVGATPSEVIEQHRCSRPPRAASLALDTPVWLDHVLAQMLEKNPAHRPYGVTAVRLALGEAERNVRQGATVAQHVAAASGALRIAANRKEAVRVLKQDESDSPWQLLKRPWVWAVGIVGVCMLAASVIAAAILFRPLDESTLLARAETLLATGKESDQKEARRKYLEPLVARFPDGQHAPRARELLDAIAVDDAERRIEVAMRFNRQPKSPFAREYLAAYKAQLAGDHPAAIAGYQAILQKESGAENDDRPYVALARRQLAAVVQAEQEQARQRARDIEEQLASAETHYQNGEIREAREIWRELVARFGDDRQFASQVERATARLNETAGQAPFEPSAQETEPAP